MGKITVMAGEYGISRDRQDILETFLGSCVGVGLHDGQREVAALAHVVLPEGSREKEAKSPWTYARSGIPFMVEKMESMGARRAGMAASVAGGASIRGGRSALDLMVGQRNVAAVRHYLRLEGIPVVFEDTGGDYGRTMTLQVGTGEVMVTTPRQGALLAAASAGTRPPPVTGELLEKTMGDLKPVSDTAMQALHLARDPTSHYGEIERLVLKDQVLAANMLRIVNSAVYGLPVRVTRVSHALSLLGLSGFKRLVLQSCVYSVFSRKLFGYSMEEGVLFQHALACARLSESVAGRCSLDREDAYVAGLLHDIGKVVLERCAVHLFPYVVDRVFSGNVSFGEAEREILGVDHAAAGGMLAVKWGFPSGLAEAIAFHHEPSFSAQSPELVAAVHLANHICNVLCLGLAADTAANPIEPQVLGLLGLGEEALVDILSNVREILSGNAC